MSTMLRFVESRIETERLEYLHKFMPNLKIVECGELNLRRDPVEQVLELRNQIESSSRSKCIGFVELDIYSTAQHMLVRLIDAKHELGVTLIHAEFEHPPIGCPFPNPFTHYEELQFARTMFGVKRLFRE